MISLLFMFSGLLLADEDKFNQLNEEAAQLFEQEAYEEALQTTYKAMQLAEEEFGPEDVKTINAIFTAGYYWWDLGELEEAEPLMAEAVKRAKINLGETHQNTLVYSATLAELYGYAGEGKKSIELYEKIIQPMQEVLGTDEESTLMAQSMLGQLYLSVGRYKEAQALLVNALTSLTQIQADDTELGLLVKENLALAHKLQGSLDKSLELYQAVLDFKQENFEADDPEIILTSVNLAEVYRLKGMYQEAKPLFIQAVKFYAHLPEEEQGDMYSVLTNLADLFLNTGEYKQAERLYQQIYNYEKKAFGDNHINTIIDLNNLGGVYRAQGRYAESEKAFVNAYNTILGLHGNDHPETISIANNLALLYQDQGLFDKAEPILKAGLAGAQKSLGESSPKTLAIMNNLAMLYESQGVFKLSEPLYNKTIILNEKTFGDNHQNTIASVNNLAYLFLIQERYDEAEKLFDKAFKIWKKELGINHQYTLKGLNNLARVYHKQDKLEQAEKMFDQALKLRKANLGESHPDVVRSMIDLAALYLSQHEQTKALKLATEAVELSEKVLGDKHPYTFEALNNLADIHENSGKLNLALSVRQDIFDRRTDFFERVLWAAGENTRQGYISINKPEQDKFLGLLVKKQGTKYAEMALNVSLKRKGLLLKIASEIHKIIEMSDSPEMAVKAEEINNKRKELSAKTLSGPVDETIQEFRQKLADLENDVNDLQAEISRFSLIYHVTSASVSVADVFENLTENEVLVDYITYDDGFSTNLIAIVARKEVGYCDDDNTCDRIVEIVPLGDLKDFAEFVNVYREVIQDEDAEDDEVMDYGNQLYDKLWKPILPFVRGRETVYLIPDGILHLLPFDAIVDDNQDYLIQKYNLNILSSARDIVVPPLPAATGQFAIFAGPDYDIENKKEEIKKVSGKKGANIDRGMRISSHGLRSLSFEPLDGAEIEGETIAKITTDRKQKSLMLTQKQADEKALRSFTQPPKMLHIATHGFFLKAEERLKRRLLSAQRGGRQTTPPPGDNPLLRAGLAFAGINSNAPFLGDIDTDNDGVLTAMEVIGLKLSGTQLVVLSACETGVGEIHAGEGVYGLRRSFQEAGVHSIINSLWPVSDEGTRLLMTEFYNELYKGLSPRDALRNAQKFMLDSEWNHPYYWAAFVVVAKK
jgi:CHAT domain-containing protein/Flp pilus assembly protein TadD